MPPQADPETLIPECGPVDRKISSVDEPQQSSSDDPPQSFWLSQDAEYDWFDRNAVLERKDSTKGNYNSNSTPSHLSNSTSQRLPVKKSILALPKPKRLDVKQRRIRSGGLTLFPRRSTSTSTAPMAEPSSPKVSCMGRVRSKRDKSKPAVETAIATVPAVTVSEKTMKKKKGFWKTFGSIFRLSKHDIQQPKEASAATPVQCKESDVVPAGLLLTKRFVSGRRSDSWIGNLVESEPPLPVKDGDKCGPVVRQRSVGPLSELNCGPDIIAAVGSLKAIAA